MKNPIYSAQCLTFAIAQNITGIHSRVTSGNASFSKPYCLRLVPAYRTAETQAFRDTVARATRLIRKGKHDRLSIVGGKLHVLRMNENGATVLEPYNN